MTNEQTGTLVLKDQAGNYFLVPQETLEQGRVPEEHTAEVERVFADQGDVQGHIWHALFTPAAIIATGVVLIVRELNKPVEQAPLPGPGGIPTGSPETISTGGGPQRI
ncbi:MAG: hypothetical protein ACRDJE_19490 [Dehalococcoidia bacterium]